MDEKSRIEKDIVMFKNNIQKLNDEIKLKNNKVIELASQYYEDSKY